MISWRWKAIVNRIWEECRKEKRIVSWVVVVEIDTSERGALCGGSSKLAQLCVDHWLEGRS